MNIFDKNIAAVPSHEGITREQFDNEIRPAGRPVILRGLVKVRNVITVSNSF